MPTIADLRKVVRLAGFDDRVLDLLARDWANVCICIGIVLILSYLVRDAYFKRLNHKAQEALREVVRHRF